MPVVAIVGPTAVGKSKVALKLADLLAPAPVEIVNADAMQLYRGMDIGTAKATAAERAAVPHHLLDLWPLTHAASVAEYRQEARSVISSLAPETWVFVVGGSGLYLAALLDELELPPTDPLVRQKWEQGLAEVGARELHAQLARRDPQAAAGIDPNNGRRIVRALEVVELTGSFSSRLPQRPRPWIPARWLGLRAPWDVLDPRIDERVEAMWGTGLVEEVAGLAEHGLRTGPTASMAIGYAECLQYLDATLMRAEAIATTARRTRQLARRQMRWFARNPRITWLDVSATTRADDLASAVLALVAER